MFDREVTLAVKDVLDLAREAGLMIATAESCTGGLIAAALTSIAGSSAVVERGFVTYSNEAKMELLGVEAATLELHGAVSEAVARAMAEGALANSRADIAVSVTGVAGPDGGTRKSPSALSIWPVRGRKTRRFTQSCRPAISVATRSGTRRSWKLSISSDRNFQAAACWPERCV